MSIIAKSVILDIADNHGDVSYLGIRSVEFFLNSVLVDVVPENAVATSFRITSFYNTRYYPYNAFDTTLSKTGSVDDTSWISGEVSTTNQRLIVYYNGSIEFDKIIINNAHSSGAYTTYGAKNVVITSSTDEIISTIYNDTITNPTVLFTGVFDQHVADNVEDPQIVYESPIFRGVFISPLVSISGEGETPITGYTDFISPLTIVMVEGETPLTGYTDFIAPLVSISGEGETPLTGYTDFIAPLVSLFGEGELPLTGYTDFDSPLVAIGCGGYVTPFIDTYLNSPLPNVSGEGNVYHHVVAGDIAANPPSISGSGVVSIIGWAVVAPRLPSISVVGDVKIMGAGHIATAGVRIHGDYGAVGNVEVSATVDAYGNVSVIGYGEVTTRPATVASTGQLSLLATAGCVIKPPAVISKGVIYPTGYGALSVPVPTVTGYGYIRTTGVVDITVKLPQIVCHADQADDYTVIRHIREGVCH
jgi:hypothetical protein